LQGYRPAAERASILFFVLNDMGKIDPMYQFSLDAYIDLFKMSIDKSQKSAKLEERIMNLNDYHTYSVYRYMVDDLSSTLQYFSKFEVRLLICNLTTKTRKNMKTIKSSKLVCWNHAIDDGAMVAR